MSGGRAAAAPPALSHLQPYLDRAEELRTSSTTVAYHLRVLAASAGLRHGSDAAAKAYLLDLMDAIEAERRRRRTTRPFAASPSTSSTGLGTQTSPTLCQAQPHVTNRPPKFAVDAIFDGAAQALAPARPGV